MTGYFFVPDADGSLARNRAREGKKAVPARGVLGMLKRLEAPRIEEGFDALYLVRALPGEEFEVMPAP